MIEKVAWHQRLTARVLFFLTLALVPLGIIGVAQNAALFDVTERRSELSLLALTETAASGERQVIQRAFGAAEAVGAMIDTVKDDPQSCRDYLRRYLDESDRFVFVGFIPLSGLTECSTADDTLDFSAYPAFADLITTPRPNIEVNTRAPGSGQSVMIVNQPSYRDGVFEGYVSISLPLDDVGASTDFMGAADPISLITFNAKGALLSAEGGRAAAADKVPAEIPLVDLAHGQARTFVATSAGGAERVYGVIPIVPDVVYALSSWRPDGPNAALTAPGRFNATLPILMWLASLLVVWFVIDRLVISRIGGLNASMRHFARDRTLPASGKSVAGSAELAMLEAAFQRMAEDLLQDEAEQEARLREKSILIKEVHHRVKNNLQIISSIMSMQIRKATSPETKWALSRVQDRIMGLSGVHRTLYQATNLTQVDAAQIIEQIIAQSRAIGTTSGLPVKVRTALSPITIYPDQAVPLSMLVAEALTNAMKYIGAPEGQQPDLLVELRLEDEDTARLYIENSCVTGRAPDSGAVPSGGLGLQLIKAFSTQLNGRMEISETPDRYGIAVVFTVEDFKEDAQDY